MNITMTLEEYKDLKSRCLTKEDWKAKEENLAKAAAEFSRKLIAAYTYRNLQDMSRVRTVAIQEFIHAIRTCFYPEDITL